MSFSFGFRNNKHGQCTAIIAFRRSRGPGIHVKYHHFRQLIYNWLNRNCSYFSGSAFSRMVFSWDCGQRISPSGQLNTWLLQGSTSVVHFPASSSLSNDVFAGRMCIFYRSQTQVSHSMVTNITKNSLHDGEREWPASYIYFSELPAFSELAFCWLLLQGTHSISKWQNSIASTDSRKHVYQTQSSLGITDSLVISLVLSISDCSYHSRALTFMHIISPALTPF